MIDTQFARQVCRLLKIQLPTFRRNASFDSHTQLAAIDVRDNVLYLGNCADPRDMFYAIAHELRHRWQYLNHWDIASHADITELSVEDYNLQPEEIDAHAFAVVVMRSIGCEPLLNGLSDEAKAKIREHATKIYNDIKKIRLPHREPYFLCIHWKRC